MKLGWMNIVALAAAAVLLASCSGGGGEAPGSSASAGPVLSASAAPEPSTATATAGNQVPAPAGNQVPAPVGSPPTSGPTKGRPAPVGSSTTGRPASVGSPTTTGRLTPLKPVIGRVWTTPTLPCDAGWCTLLPPVGTVTFHAAVSGATSVQFLLVPTGTETAAYATSIGLDTDGRDGWTAQYTYADEPLMSHLAVVARGPGGEVESLPFNLYHPE